jgi:hypothetical protein
MLFTLSRGYCGRSKRGLIESRASYPYPTHKQHWEHSGMFRRNVLCSLCWPDHVGCLLSAWERSFGFSKRGSLPLQHSQFGAGGRFLRSSFEREVIRSLVAWNKSKICKMSIICFPRCGVSITVGRINIRMCCKSERNDTYFCEAELRV